MSIIDQFNNSAENVKNLSFVSDDNKLKLYGLYKQSTIGDINTTRPSGMFNIKEKAKYDAWNENKGMSKEKAMNEYISLVSNLN
jgi:diazepam-binding inhibitor (GABA receptor modulating acyl-CoA-binding protein)